MLLAALITGCTGPLAGGGPGVAAAPQGEHWTIRCLRSTAADRRQTIELMAKGLRNVKQLDARKVRVEHAPAASTLYYGTYVKTFDAQAGLMRFPPDMTRDIRFIRQLAMGDQYPFEYAEPELVAGTGASGPPEWDLRRAPGRFSLQVAVFYNEGEFRERELAAVQYCKALRDEGLEAWYHHGANGRSIVCVGHFDDEQAQAVEKPDGTKDYSDEVKRVMNLREEFKYNLINGRIHKHRAAGGEFVPVASFLVPIPAAEDPDAEDWGFEKK